MVGVPSTVNAEVLDVICLLTGLLILISIPADPEAVSAAITTTIVKAETIEHEAIAPEEGIVPIFAVQD
jgi:hypothetical protein